MELFTFFVFLFSIFSVTANAGGTAVEMSKDTPVASPLEISGHATVLAGYQHDGAGALASSQSITTPFGAGGLTQGDLGFAPGNNAEHFVIQLDEIEIDLAKHFGERMRLQVDLDATDLVGNGRGVADAFSLEQAFVTFDFDGFEWLVGKFNIPIGLEYVDRSDNPFVTFTPGTNYLIASNVIGTRLLWNLSDSIDCEVGIANNLNGTITGNSAMPSGFARMGFFWGDVNRRHNINIAGAIGPEQSVAVNGASHNGHLDYTADLWGQIYPTKRLEIGFEGTFRQTNATAAGAKNQKGLAGQIYGIFDLNDKLSLQARFATLWDVNPISGAFDGVGSSITSSTWGGFEGWTYSGTLGAQYHLTEGASLKGEYRLDDASTAGSAANPLFHTLVAELVYFY